MTRCFSFCYGAAAAFILTATVLLSAPVAQAQTAQSIIEAMQAQHLRQFEAIDTYVVETVSEGDTTVAYHRKVRGGASPQFQIAERSRSALYGEGDVEVTTEAPFEQFAWMGARGQYTGTQSIDGVRHHVLTSTTPPDTVALALPMGGEVKEVTFYVGVDDNRLRRMVVTGRPPSGATVGQGVTIDFTEYRTVDGLTLPWTIEMKISLPPESLSPAQRRDIENMQARLQKMDAAEQASMREMMGPERFERALRGEPMGGGPPIVFAVQQVAVNVPLPDDVFYEPFD